MRSTGWSPLRSRGVGLWIVCLFSLVGDSHPVWAQPPTGTTSSGSTPSLIVISDPPGATVILDGPMQLIGQTPWTLTRNISGLYQVTVRRPGYESWNGEVVVGAGNTLSVKLTKRSRTRAVLRSLFVPGWGQAYAGEPTKGKLFFGVEVLALSGLVWTNELYQDDVDDFDEAARRYRNATHLEDLPDLRSALDRAGREADRSYDRRRILTTAAVGVYALSILDALVLAPTSNTAQVNAPMSALLEPTAPALALALELSPHGASRVGLSVRW